MEFFQNMRRDNETHFFFFPTIYANGLQHFLFKSKLTGWDIYSQTQIRPYLPEGFTIPEVRLTPTAPRVEKRISCLVSYYNTEDVEREYNSLLLSQEWLDHHNNNARNAMAEHEFKEAMAKDPSPFSPFKQTKN